MVDRKLKKITQAEFTISIQVFQKTTDFGSYKKTALEYSFNAATLIWPQKIVVMKA